MANRNLPQVEMRWLHKSLRGRFRVDVALFQAQPFNAERKDCGYRSCSLGAQNAMAQRAVQIALDPVETGQIGARDAARNPSLNPGGEACEQGGS